KGDVQAGQQLTASMFQPAAEAAKSDAPPGKELVTVSLEPDRALGGRIKVGDSVAVIATLKVPVSESKDVSATRMLMRKVLVTAVQGDVMDRAPAAAVTTDAASKDAAKKAAAEPTSRTFLVTLAVPPDVAQRVVHAAED